MRLIDADELTKAIKAEFDYASATGFSRKMANIKSIDLVGMIFRLTDNAPTVELDEVVIQKVLKPRCMTVITNEYLIELITKQRSQGKWIFHKDFNESCRYGCNQCGNLTNSQGNFCPNCGVKMKKGD